MSSPLPVRIVSSAGALVINGISDTHLAVNLGTKMSAQLMPISGRFI
jgi:hypothetical protein